MKLQIITPLAVVLDENGVLAVRAEDASGHFGILPGHAEFLSSLAISVVSWKTSDSAARYCAVRRGMISVTGGSEVVIATREAMISRRWRRMFSRGSAPPSRWSARSGLRARGCN